MCCDCLQGPKAVLGPGTGLGEAQLFWDKASRGYKVWPSEGAHAQFAPRGWRQRALQMFIEAQLGYCEVEHVRSSSNDHDVKTSVPFLGMSS